MASPCGGVGSFIAEVARAFDSAASARHGRPSPLYDIRDISRGANPPFCADEPHGLPMIRLQTPPPLERFRRCDTDENFKRRLEAYAPYLADFAIAAAGIVIAGRTVRALLMMPDELCSKMPHFELYLANGQRSADEFTRAASYVGDHLATRLGCLTVDRSHNCITFTGVVYESLGTPIVVQVQLDAHQYGSPAELLSTFPLTSSQVCWDGRRILASDLGRIGIHYRVNIVNLEVRDESYEKDLIRDLQVGYAIVAPELGFDPSGRDRITFGGMKCRSVQHSGCLCTLRVASIEREPAAVDTTKVDAESIVECVRKMTLEAKLPPTLYTPGLDVRTVSPAAGLEGLIPSMITRDTICHAQLIRLIGAARTRELIDDTIMAGSVRPETVRRIVAATVAAATAMPFPLGPKQVKPTSKAAWYGESWIWN
jgi:hypothetical protein